MPLVLSRQVDEVIEIETPLGTIEILCVDIRGDKVRIGITAPKSFRVDRKEVADAIRREQRQEKGQP